MDTGDSIEKLYKNYEILSDAKEKIGEVCKMPQWRCWLLFIFFHIQQNFFDNIQHEKEYKEILDAIKGSPKEKRLASQFIGKFLKFFPNLTESAIDAQLDLCEDEDIQVSFFLMICLFLSFLNLNVQKTDSTTSYQRFATIVSWFQGAHRQNRRHFGTIIDRRRCRRIAASSHVIVGSGQGKSWLRRRRHRVVVITTKPNKK